MKYCIKCILPNTRPNLTLNSDGLCNACETHSNKIEIDWKNREGMLLKIIKNAKHRSNGYDCVIPVSGGKDSTWQVIKCLEYGLNPLAVTWKAPSRTKIGIKNLENLISLGVDHIDYQINPKVEKRFLYSALEKFGSTGIPMHMAIFNIPLKIAFNFNIPLIVWGENSDHEYGGTKKQHNDFHLNKSWFEKFGVTHGTTADDWVSNDLTKKNLEAYFSPSFNDLKEKNILSIFLGHFLPWDPEISFSIASRNGFKERKKGAKTGFYKYADIDDDFISIHHYLKWYKFGFSRIFDNLSIEIRNGRISREEALKIIKDKGDSTPYDDIEKFCNFLNISKKKFFRIIEKFRNLKIWEKHNNVWQIKNFIINDWEWK